MDNMGNPWKLATIGIVLVVTTAVVTTLVVAGLSKRDVLTTAEVPAAGSASPSMPSSAALATSTPAAVPQAAVTAPTQPRPAAVPPRATIDACNRYAANRPTQKDKTVEIVKDGAIGGALGAAVGAAGGAIADGGKGAGTGAAIGGLVGIAGGALYGVNENKKNDERYRHAYASCMRARGYGG